MRKKRDAVIAIVAVGCMYGFCLTHCDISDFVSGVLAGLATIITAAMWHEL